MRWQEPAESTAVSCCQRCRKQVAGRRARRPQKRPFCCKIAQKVSIHVTCFTSTKLFAGTNFRFPSLKCDVYKHLRNACLCRPVSAWTRTHQTFSYLRMPLQRMLAGAGRCIPDLNSAVIAPRGDGRRLLVVDYSIDSTLPSFRVPAPDRISSDIGRPAKLRRLL